MQLEEIRPRLKNELAQWFIRQCKNPFDRYYLYYQDSRAEHTGGFLIKKDKPSKGSFQLARAEHIDRGKTVEQNFNILLPVINKLHILDV